MTDFPGSPTDPRLVAAETRMARALQRIAALRRESIRGVDRRQFDRALAEFRAAEEGVLAARRVATRIEDLTAQPPGRLPAQAAGPGTTNRMRFVKWLVETGRLSDWDVAA